MTMVKRALVLLALVAVSACGQAKAPVASVAAVDSEPKAPAEPEAAKAPAAENPFFVEWKTPFGVPPFDAIVPAHYLPAIERGISEDSADIAAIAQNPEAPTFANTLEALDRTGALLTKVAPVFFNHVDALASDEIQKIAEKVMPALTKHRDDVLLNEALFARVKAVYEQRDTLSLTPEQKTLLEETYLDFVRGGIALGADAKAELRKINEELSLLHVKFGDNVLKENNKFALVIDKKEDLEGLPESAIAAAAEAAEKRGKKGAWVFTLHKPSLIPFLQYAAKRELREAMFKGYITRGDHDDELDNKAGITRIVELRARKAKLLGYETFADYVLERRMAKTPKGVYGLLDEVWKYAKPAARAEAKALTKIMRKDGVKGPLQPWDWWYYSEKLRAEKYAIDENELRSYFQLEKVRDAAFDLAGRLYGVKFTEKRDVPVYHPDVRVFEVTEADGAHLGLLFLDFFPRESKSNGAWCGGFRDQHMDNGVKVTPLVTNVFNFSKPTEGKPALLSVEEVTTLFHEFGHALHSLFSDVVYTSSSQNVKTDFVELPSQVMENWAMEPEFLVTYARHYETGEAIPEALIRKLAKSKTFNEGFVSAEYVAASYLDMDWHMQKESPKDVRAFEKQALDRIGLLPEIVVRYRSTYFKHIFDGEYYAAGYYSYLWSQVLDADAYDAFKEKGLFDTATAKSFRENVLARGGSEDPMELYVRFRGKKPSTAPMLRRSGFVK